MDTHGHFTGSDRVFGSAVPVIGPPGGPVMAAGWNRTDGPARGRLPPKRGKGGVAARATIATRHGV